MVRDHLTNPWKIAASKQKKKIEKAQKDLLLFEERAKAFDSKFPPDQLYNSCVHTSHCCTVHGCEYGSDNCPVQLEKLPQEYPCEMCACWWDKYNA